MLDHVRAKLRNLGPHFGARLFQHKRSLVIAQDDEEGSKGFFFFLFLFFFLYLGNTFCRSHKFRKIDGRSVPTLLRENLEDPALEPFCFAHHHHIA